MSSRNESLDQVLEQACIDLIQRNRRGEFARVEDYLKQYPALGDPAYLLDLVDAEICVRKELGESTPAEHWSERFPQQSRAIKQLLALEGTELPDADSSSAFPLDIVARSSDDSLLDESPSSLSDEFSVATGGSLTSGRREASCELATGTVAESTPALFPNPPIQPPLEFIVDCGVAMQAGSWLLRCHEEGTQTSLAFKIRDVARPASGGLSSRELKWLLDANERAATVRHPVWVRPLVATCDGQFLGVIRPWIFGVRWPDAVASLATSEAFRLLAELAFSLQAAHQSGCYHGNVCENNLFLTHDGGLKLTDPANSLLPEPSTTATTPSIAALDDAMMFCRLLATLQLDTRRGLSHDLVAHGHEVLVQQRTDTMALLGEWLIKVADDPAVYSSSSRSNVSLAMLGWLKSKLFSRRGDVVPSVDPTFH